MTKIIKNHQKMQNLIQNEQGRSMVEMLGVLAVIGVLSVGAISGYRYAMNKYRANQTVNELNLLSHQVAIAMMSKNGVTELKLGEPYETNKKLTSAGYNFEFGCGDGTTPDCDGKYYFNVQDVSEGVCKELVQMSEHMQFLKTRTDTCSAGNNTLNFVFELPDGTSGGASSETSSDAFDESDLDQTVDHTCSNHGHWEDCGAGCTCNSGYTGLDCQCDSGTYWNGSTCVSECSEGTQADSNTGECVKGCTSNADCMGAGEYCYLRQGSGCENGQEFSGGWNGTRIGSCRNAKADAAKVGDYIVSKVGMTWWSAGRFCDALGGKHQATLAELGCDKHTMTCPDDIYTQFKNAGIHIGWTADLDGDGSCYTDSVIFSNSFVSTGNRDNPRSAICR